MLQNRMLELSDETLLTRLLAGCEESFNALYRRYQALIYRFALEMSGLQMIAEEATQEVFLSLLRGECRYDPVAGRLRPFLVGVARNHVLRLLRRDGRYVPLPDGAGDTAAHPSVLVDLTRRQMVDAVRRAVLSLPVSYREVVALCDLEELEYAEAAEALGCPVGTVRSRLHRARALLAEKLAPTAAQYRVRSFT